MIKLISSDMDGTLLDSYRQITPINVEAIKRAQENGINFIINTGREYPRKIFFFSISFYYECISFYFAKSCFSHLVYIVFSH